LGLEHAVLFTGALYDQEKIAPWCLSACCFPYPPDIGLGLQHAMAYGVPVITNDDMDVHGPEIHALREGENGLLFRNNDAEDLASKMLRLMKDSELHARMSAAAYATVRGPDGWSIEHMAGQFAKCIRAVAKSR
jgi:glycosyltransferase involved in cell wall biosynthesis